MNAPHPLGHAALASIDVRERRRRRAVIAARLVAGNGEALGEVDWKMLDHAPEWLGLPDARLATLQRQIGAVLHAGDIRLWIDGPRIAAARNAVGDAFYQALLVQRDLAAFAPDAGKRKRIDQPDQVAPHLQMAGAAVLLASLPQGPLRRSVVEAMAPTVPAPIAAELALSLIARAASLAAGTSTTLAGAPANAPARAKE